MKANVSVLLFFLCSQLALAQNSQSVIINFSTNSNSDNIGRLELGVSNDATDCVDQEIGEVAVPLEPPGAVFWQHSQIVCPPDTIITDTVINGEMVVDTTILPEQSFILQGKDIRRLSDSQFSRTISYEVKLKKGIGTELTLDWQSDNWDYVATARILYSDSLIGEPIDMKSTNSVSFPWLDITDVLRHNRFFIEITYDFATSVDKDVSRRTPMEVFPNPTNDQLIIGVEGEEQHLSKRYEVFDLQGRSVLSGSHKIRDIRIIPTEKLEPGMYILRYFVGKKVYHKNFIKK